MVEYKAESRAPNTGKDWKGSIVTIGRQSKLSCVNSILLQGTGPLVPLQCNVN